MMKQNSTMHKRPRRKLEDLNLIDNFLFQEMLTQEDVRDEFCRILLRTILGREIRNIRVVPQKNVLGVDTDKHGIRMDAYIEEVPTDCTRNTEALIDADILPEIYDIEPNKTYEKDLLPKRMRYYHGLIDTQLLASDMDYDQLPKVVIIIILPYDPFNKKRMIYTIQNQCVEDPTVPYNDGALKIFLYTKGTEGNPSKTLRDMLKYIETSVNDNVTNQDIETLNNLVIKVKQRKEVNISYMKSWEYEKMIRKEAAQEGREEGFALGREEGLSLGREEGLSLGREEGLSLGREEGLSEGMRAFVTLCIDFHATYEDTIKKVAEKFQLSYEAAESYVSQYWNC